MNLDKKRWLVLVASCLINLCIGSLYAWSVFAGPLLEKLNSSGAGLTNISIVYTIANSVGPITMITGGLLTDKLGIKRLIFFGGILFGGGMILTGRVTTLTGLIVTYGLMVGLAIGMVYGCTISNSVCFFPDKKGMAGGLATASFGGSSVLMPLVVVRLNNAFGLEKSLLILGASMMIIICVSSFFIEQCPAGYAPAGYQRKAGVKTTGNNYTWKEMIRSREFYLMFSMLLCGAFPGMILTSSAMTISKEMMSMETADAASVVSVVAVFNTVGRVFAGTLSDKLGNVRTILYSFIAAFAAQGILLASGSTGITALFIAGCCLTGLCFGATMGVYPSFTASRFGQAHNNVNYAIIFIGFTIAGYFGPAIMNAVHDSTGHYDLAFAAGMVFAAAGFLLTVIEKKVEKE